jgi:hypothetical protein
LLSYRLFFLLEGVCVGGEETVGAECFPVCLIETKQTIKKKSKKKKKKKK